MHPEIASDRTSEPSGQSFVGNDDRDIGGRSEHSLMEDVRTLISDGKTYVEAELAYQKNRAGYTATQAQAAFVLGLGALALLHLALIGLTVGLIFALTPHVGSWLAMAIVVGLLLVGALLFAFRLKARLSDIRGAFAEGKQ